MGVVAFVIGRWTAVPETPTTPTVGVADPSTEASALPLVASDAGEEPTTDHLTPVPDDAKPDEPEAASVESVYYRNCSAARAAGAAPIREGDPGYAGHLDRDGDGIACE